MIPPVDLAPGHLLGRYELLIAIAQGGMGTVWAARDRGSPAGDRIVAVKTMLPALSSDPRCKRMFLTESRIASRIKHPNVCAILDQGEQNGVLYFVMEWIDGDALVELLGGSTRKQNRPIPLPVAVRIAIEAARGLHAAHELRDDGGALIGLVHRDVSPHNILITRDGSVKIADFGVAKAVAQADNPTTNTGHMKGKILFMAPEQVYSETLDRRSDIFALGIVLYQLTTGTHPFAASHDLATMARIARPEPVDPPSSLVPGYPPELEAAVVRALAKDPAERFPTMAELAEALEAVNAALGARREEVTAYIRDALATRVARRAAVIRDAVRAADGWSRGRPFSRLDPRRRARTIATAAALVASGALLGAATLLWIGLAEGPAAPGVAVPAPPAFPAEPRPRIATAEPRAALPEPPREAALSSSSSPAAPPSAAPAPSASPAPPPARAPAETGRAKFRDPGF
ncbi:serine/threonine-protein kinase [Sorangium cellulosum]|uniref:serine/threonine-protein kinase n=1 Tax=Sorangium cellulosum TaxID=56 RepID=UPI001F5C2392|nr:serine/threonine-protein kinase [Sorangium cellulosum]